LKPITLIFKPSRMLITWVVSAALFFSTMLLLVPIPLSLGMLLVLLIIMSTTYFIRLDGLLSLTRSWKLLQINKAGECYLMQKNDESFVVQIMPDSFVSAHLTILHVVAKEFTWLKVWQSRYILLLQDSTDAESLRQLRVYLRWRKNFVNNPPNLPD